MGMGETEYLLDSPQNAKRLQKSVKELKKYHHQIVKLIEQDGEKFVILPDNLLEQCGVGDVVDISVENGCIVLKAAGSN